MLRLDPSIIPDPSNTERGDCYGLRGSSAPPEVVVLDVVRYPTFEVRAVMFGHLDMLTVADFSLVMAALKLEPMGRMTSAPVNPRIEPPEDFHLLARTFGPILRMIRERHHVNLGHLARALGCRTAALSAFELGECPGDPPRLGTSAWNREGHADGLAATVDTSEQGERIYSLLQTIEEAAGILDNESIVSDAQHLQEAMKHASKHLRKALTT